MNNATSPTDLTATAVHGASPLTGNELSAVVVTLLRGPLYRDTKPELWAALDRFRARVADYVAVLGLSLIVDENEGYAFLRSGTDVADLAMGMTVDSANTDTDTADPDAAGTGGSGGGVPRLMARRPLTFPVSLLLALLRKRLAEFDTEQSELRLVMTRAEIVEMVKVFLPDETNEAKLIDRVDSHINKVVELGFLRVLRATGGAADDRRDKRYEVRRILQAFVDAQWLESFDERLAEYRERLVAESGEEGEE